MAHFRVEGDIENISAPQLGYICKVLEERGFKDEKIEIKAVGKPGDNYVANVKRIVVSNKDKQFSMIAKIAPTIEALRNAMNTQIMFHNEHVMYTEVLPKFTELQEAAEVPDTERLRYADCYGSFTEAPNEIILLEDLVVSDYEMLDRFKSLTDDCVRLMLKNFAILHSSSYPLKHLEPETYTAFVTKLINPWPLTCKAEGIDLYFAQIDDEMMTILDNDTYKKNIKGKVSDLPNSCTKMAKIDSESKYSIIQQGDSWTNNIMFRLQDNKAVKCCMIDYQVSKESNPVADIHYMIFNCTDYETRSQHYHDWIDYYHTELDNALSNYGLKASFVYPKDQLDADLRRHGKLTLGLGVLLASMLIRESADAEKVMSAMEESIMTEGNMEGIFESAKVTALDAASILRFKTRIEGLVRSMIELGYL